MDYLRKNKLMGWVVLALILLNTATLTLLWLGKNGKGPRKGGPAPGRDLLEKELNLTDEQVQKIQILREEHFQNTRQIRNKSHDERSKLHTLWQKEGAREEAAASAGQIGELQEALELETFDHFSKMRKVLNEEQKRKFDKIILDVLKRGDGIQGGPPPGGPNGRRGPGRPGDRPPPRDGQ